MVKQLKKISTYLRDFSIVVAGIALTLWVQSWLTSRSEKKDTMLYLSALKMELESNRDILDSVLMPAMENSLDYIRYISTHDKKTLNSDSLQSYYYTYYNIPPIKFEVGAFEMFKISGNMRLITDKEILSSIYSLYSKLAFFENWVDRYYQDKMGEVRKDFQLDNKEKGAIPMYHFYHFYSMNGEYEQDILQHAKRRSAQIKELISRIEKITS